MTIDKYLRSLTLHDCQGRVSHTLTLLPIGQVRVTVGHREATVDPTTRVVHPPGRNLSAGEYHHDQIVDMACAFITDLIR